MISDFVMLLNNILQTFTEPTSFVTNRPLLGKLSFSKEQALSHLIEIYANLDVVFIFNFRSMKNLFLKS